jgi:putative nucleotidyltransferase with HDIG domain
MNRSFGLLAALAAPTALALFLCLLILDWGVTFGTRDIGGLVAFICVAVFSEMRAVDFRFGTGKQQPRSSMAFLPFLGMIAIFSPPISVVVVVSVVAISQLLLRRNAFMRAAYNMSQAGVCAAVAAAVYHGLPIGLAAFPFAAIIFFAANIILSALAIAYIKGEGVRPVLAQIMGPNFANLRYDFLASPIAAVPVLLYDLTEFGILVIVFPLLLFHHFHVSKQQYLDAHKDLLRALVKAIETRDPYTSGHSVRVATMAREIAKNLRLPGRRVDKIETAALLHDIGKIDPLYSNVLRKPHDLTAEERLLIQTHAVRGADLLADLQSVDAEVTLAVRHHHERFDGRGYPSGLVGDEIPLAARIIMLCDSVDAMLSDRPYRKALSVATVQKELLKCAGTQFDPDIVSIVLKHDTLLTAAALTAPETSREKQLLAVM